MAKLMEQPGEQPSDSLAVRWLKAEPNLRAFVASAIWDTHHAEDVIQEVASVASKSFESFDDSRPFLPWVLGIARLKVLEYFRSRSRDKATLSDGTLLALESAARDLPEDLLTARRAALQSCVQKLAGRQRRVIEMKYLLGKSLLEIAGHLNTSNSSVAVTLHRARTKLRACIKQTVAAEMPE